MWYVFDLENRGGERRRTDENCFYAVGVVNTRRDLKKR